MDVYDRINILTELLDRNRTLPAGDATSRDDEERARELWETATEEERVEMRAYFIDALDVGWDWIAERGNG